MLWAKAVTLRLVTTSSIRTNDETILHAYQRKCVFNAGGAVICVLRIGAERNDVRRIVERDLHADVGAFAALLDRHSGVFGVGVAGHQLVAVFRHPGGALNRLAIFRDLGFVQPDLYGADGEGVFDRRGRGQERNCPQH